MRWELILLIAAVLLAAGAVLALLRTRRTMTQLEQMLEEAIRGTFSPERYDESRLSRLEQQLARFLTASTLSRRQIEADRANITRTIGDISHQTKTPIANLRLYTELLREQPLNEEERQLAGQIAAQTDKLDALIQALVKTSRLETGVVRPMPEANSVNDLLDALTEAWAAPAADRGLTFTCVCPEELTACFDPKWTAEALGNLMDNALKYTPSGGNVTVSARRFELFCRIDVADTGCGIPEREQAAVFGRFTRGSGVSQAEGVGIGLYLAREIIAAQSGYIKGASRPGEGSVFSVYLPTGD